jgi:hypothetical protein
VPVKKRTPIDTEGVGTIIIRDTSIEAVAGPAIPKDDTPSVKTTFVGVSADKGGLNVTTNYVKVLQVPDKLHVDSLTFWRKKRKSSISFRSRPADEATRLEMATKEINDADSLKLTVGKNVWATDCKVLWCTTALSAPAQDKATWDTAGTSCRLLLERSTKECMPQSVSAVSSTTSVPTLLETTSLTHLITFKL